MPEGSKRQPLRMIAARLSSFDIKACRMNEIGS